MIYVSPEVYMVLIKGTSGIWAWLTIALGQVIGSEFWSPADNLIYTWKQLFG